MKAETISPNRPPRATLDGLITPTILLLGTLLLLWPAVLNRAPFILSDTTTYIRGADAAVYKLTGVKTGWTDRFVERYQGGETPRAAGSRQNATLNGRAVTLSGRSVYYGAFLYLADLLGGLWMAVFLQAALASLCLYLTIRRFVGSHRQSGRAYLAVVTLLSAASSLAWFTGYLMPDLFTGLGVLAAAHLLCRAPPLRAKERYFWLGLLGWSALAHSSNILILSLLVGAMLISRAIWHAPRLRALGLIVIAVLAGVAGEAVFALSVRAVSGDAPVRPPFLMARIIADGPGLAYLQRTCPHNGFDLCKHMGGMSRNSDNILWNEPPNGGVFSAVGNDEKRRIANEEPRFLIAVFEDRPLDVLRSSAGSIWQQARKWHLDEFNLPIVAGADSGKLPARVANQLARGRAERGDMPIMISEVLALAASLIGLAVLLWSIWRRSTDPSVRLFVAALLIGIAADIVVCGAMSTPHDRYSMRVLWLLPLGALVVLIRTRKASRDTLH